MKIAARMGIVCDWERIRLRPAMRVGIVPVHCWFKKWQEPCSVVQVHDCSGQAVMNFSTSGRAELRWEETVGNSLGGAWLEHAARKDRKTVQIALGEICWEGASMQRGQTGNFGNSLGRNPL